MGDQSNADEQAEIDNLMSADVEETEMSTCLAFRVSLTDFTCTAAVASTLDGEDIEGTDPAESALPDVLVLSTTLLGESVVSAPISKGDDGTYDFSEFSHVFLRDESKNLLLNSLVRDCVLAVDVLDAKDTAQDGEEQLPLASLSLDLSPFLEGQESIGGGDSPLTFTASNGSKTSGEQVHINVALASGTFTVEKKSVVQSDEAAGDAAPADEVEDNSATPSGQFMPLPLLSGEESAGSVIVTTQLSAISPIPAPSLLSGCILGDDVKDETPVLVEMGVASIMPCGTIDTMAADGFASIFSTFSMDSSAEEDASSISPTATNACKTFISSPLKDTIIEKLVAKEPMLVEMMMTSSTPSVSEEKSSEVQERMHAIASVDLSPLLEPGCSSLTATVLLTAPEPPSLISTTPLNVAPLLPCFSTTTTTTTTTDMPPNNGLDDNGKGNLWSTSSCSMCLELTFSRPLIPPWEAPSKPSMTVDKLIPSRSQPRDQLDEERGVKMFGERVQDISRQMCEVYLSAVASQANKKQSLTAEQIGDGSLSESEKINRRRALIYELNKSGAYMSMKESLKSSVVAIVREKFCLSGSMSKDEMSAVYNDLYVLLSEKAHGILNGERAEVNNAMRTSDGSGLDGKDNTLRSMDASKKEEAEVEELRSELSKLKDLADELEAEGDFSSAAAQHQSRLSTANSKSESAGVAKSGLKAAVWYDYGAFCMRSSPPERAKAEECFRECLQCCSDAETDDSSPDTEMKPRFESEVPSLILLASLLICDGILEQAEVYAYRAMELMPSACTWSLLALLYEDLGRVKERDNSLYMSKKLALSDAPTAISAGNSSHKAMELTLLLLDTHLHEVASRALEQAMTIMSFTSSSGPDSDGSSQQQVSTADETDSLLCQARCDELSGNLEEAGTCLRKASVIAPAASKSRVLVMLGKHYASLGSVPEAIASLESAMKIADGFVPLDAYMMLCTLHSSCGNHAVARVRYLDACRSCPCCSTWLGAGIASYRLGLLHDAEMCLSEANVLDNYRPNVWGYLALVSLAAGRPEESAQAIRLAIQNGIKDANILAELGDMYKNSGKTVEAVRLYRLATGCSGCDSSVFVRLGEALVNTRDFKRAREALVMAMQLQQGSGAEQDYTQSVAELVKKCDLELGIVEE